MLVEIRTASIESIVQNGLMIEHGSVSVVDPSGNKIVDISNEPAASTLIEERVTLANGWQIVFSCAIVRSILQGLRPLCVVLIVILAGSFLMSTVVGRHVANGVSEPISELLAQMDASDDIRVRIKASIPSDIYEIDRLITNYNKLILRIQELFAELEQRSKEVKRSEFAALQAQINPHFLYNTLDTISWLIRRGRDEDALKTLMAFSQFFRISLNKGARNIPVRLEVRHAELYLNIQKMRFDSDFDFEIQNYLQTTDLENVHVPKLILQPLIENAIIHGIQPRMGQGKIVVAIERMGDELVFKVWDNGCGIPAEELRRINAGLQNANIDTEALSSNYGLSNVNLRIKHIFGESYGLRLESVEKEYTQAIINIPVKYDGGMDF